MKYASIFVAYFLVHHLFAFGQTDTTSGNYKTYKDKYSRFSFSMPIEWNVVVDKDGELPNMAFSIKKDTIKDYQTEIFIINYYEYKGLDAI